MVTASPSRTSLHKLCCTAAMQERWEGVAATNHGRSKLQFWDKIHSRLYALQALWLKPSSALPRRAGAPALGFGGVWATTSGLGRKHFDVSLPHWLAIPLLEGFFNHS